MLSRVIPDHDDSIGTLGLEVGAGVRNAGRRTEFRSAARNRGLKTIPPWELMSPGDLACISISLDSQYFGEELCIHHATEHLAAETVFCGVTLQKANREAS